MANVHVGWKPLYVSSVVGGSSANNRAIRAAVSQLARRVGEVVWDDEIDEIGVDVVFHVAGPLMAPDYAGVRTGRLSKQKKLMTIQVAVPDTLQNATEAQAIRVLSMYLLEAAELAQRTVAARKNIQPVVYAVKIARTVVESIA